MRISELKEKDVINICDGERLGNVCDIDFEKQTGKICALIVPGPCKILGILGRDQEYVIPYCQVRKIGGDAILVEIDPKKCLKNCEIL